MTYVGTEDVIRDRRLVDGRVLVGLEVDEGIVGYAFGNGCLYNIESRLVPDGFPRNGTEC